MSIRKKILYTFVTITSIAIFFTAIVAFDSAKGSLTTIIGDNLTRVTMHKKMMIEMYFEELREDITVAKGMKSIVAKLLEIHATNKGATQFNFSALDSELKSLQIEKGLEDFMLVDTQGKIVYSLNPLHKKADQGLLLNRYAQGGFEAGMKDIYISDIFRNTSPIAGYEIGMLGIGPVFDENKKFLGEVVLEVRPDELFRIISENIAIGKSAETIVSKKRNEKEIDILSPLLYRENAVLDKTNAIGGTYGVGIQLSNTQVEGNGIIRDYRGVRTLAHWAYIPSLKWGIVSKIDETEAFRSVDDLKKKVLLILLITLVGVIAISHAISKSIIVPVEKLQEEVKTIVSGDLSHRITNSSSDETGALAEAFNSMTERLSGFYSGLDRKVKRRTETIEKEKSKFLSLAENLPVGVMMVEVATHRIVAINKSMMSLLMAQKSPLGEKVEPLLRTHMYCKGEDGREVSKKHMPMINVLSGGKELGTMDIQLDRTHHGDGIIWVRTMTSSIKDKKGKNIFVTMVMEDITKDKQIDKAKSEFVSLASHQFRTPLTAINWYIEILLKEYGGKMNARQKMLIHEVANGGQRLGILVNTMLNISRIDMDTFTIELKKVDVKSVVKKVLKDVDKRIKNHHLHVEVGYQDKLPNIMADESAMEIVIQNLITNAVKYTKYGGLIVIHASIVKRGVSIGGRKMEEDNFIITVKDDGYGIKKSDQKNIFSKFYRASNVHNVPAEGTGLGLYLVKNMLGNIGGVIWFESEENKGSTFYVSFPRAGMRPHKGKGVGGGKKFETLSAASIEAEIPDSEEEVEEKDVKEKHTAKKPKK